MSQEQKKKLIILIIVLILTFASILGLNFLSSKQSENANTQQKESTTVPTSVTKVSTDSAMNAPSEVTISSTKLANAYFVYEKSEYEKAKAANRPIFLFFFANWCPTCELQEPIVVKTFNSLSDSNVIGFRVNYNDSDTSADEKSLAQEFGVRYQHTMFTLDSNGTQVDKFLGETSESKLKESFTKVK